MNEIWKPIPGYDNYFVSNLGNVKRGAYIKLTDKGIEQQIDETALPVTVFQNSKYVSIQGKSCLLHLIVANAFLNTPGPSSRVEFIDGDRMNCAADNMRWTSISEITKRDIASGRRSNPAPYTGMKVICVESGETYSSIKSLCESLKLPRSYVTKRIYSKEPINNKLYKRA